jgi:hypothetical protein
LPTRRVRITLSLAKEVPVSTENLFAPSAIKLFGLEFRGLSVNRPLLEDPKDPPLEKTVFVESSGRFLG